MTAATNINGDHHLDLVTVGYSFLGQGDDTFAAVPNLIGGSSDTHYEVLVGDFNTDSKPDLATVNFYNGSIGVRLGSGVRLQWPNWPGYLLESSTNLRNRTGWMARTNTPRLSTSSTCNHIAPGFLH